MVDVDLGSGVPHIQNLQALASPTATIWPQALFDLDFTGPVHLLPSAMVATPSHVVIKSCICAWVLLALHFGGLAFQFHDVVESCLCAYDYLSSISCIHTCATFVVLEANLRFLLVPT